MSDGYRVNSRNCMLVKDDVGKAKPSVYNLPPEGHAFGRSDPADLEGAREVTMHWASHVPRSQSGPECQDFKKINKSAAKSGVANARQLVEFRKSNDIKLIPQGPAGCLPKVIPSDVIPSFAYGRKSRPSTPIASVVGGHYASEYEEALDSQYRKYADEADMPNGKRRIKLTKATTDRIMQARSRRSLGEAMEIKEPFKLTKFKKVPSRLQLPALRKTCSMPNLAGYNSASAMHQDMGLKQAGSEELYLE